MQVSQMVKIIRVSQAVRELKPIQVVVQLLSKAQITTFNEGTST